jgi:hypothetical protein
MGSRVDANRRAARAVRVLARMGNSPGDGVDVQKDAAGWAGFWISRAAVVGRRFESAGRVIHCSGFDWEICSMEK